MSIEKFAIAKSYFTLKDRSKKFLNNSAENIIIDIIDFITKSAGNDGDFNWADWHIGLTVYPHQEKREQGKLSKWKSWKANSASDALKIQNYFLDNFPINLNRKNGLYDYFVYILKK